jgi:hypothetical protein
VFEKIKSLFDLMGKNISLVGGNCDGQTTKVAKQIIVSLTIKPVGEALLCASKASAAPAKGALGPNGRLCFLAEFWDCMAGARSSTGSNRVSALDSRN